MWTYVRTYVGAWLGLVARFVTVAWPVGTSWFGRLAPVSWRTGRRCSGLLWPGCLIGPNWLDGWSPLVDRLVSVGLPVGPGWLANWSRIFGTLAPVRRPVGPGWLAAWYMPVGWPACSGLLVGWSLLVGRLLPFVCPVDPFLLAGLPRWVDPGRFRVVSRLVLVGWSWLVDTYGRT